MRPRAAIARSTLGALAAALLALAMPAHAGAALSFEAHRTWPVGAQPRSVGVADITKGVSSGAPDVITANFDANNLTVFDGPFFQNCSTCNPPPQPYTVGNGPVGMMMVRLDSDFAPEAVVANSGSDTVSVRPGNDAVRLGQESTYAVGNEPVAVTAGQFRDPQNSQRTAVFVANASDDTVQMLLARFDGSLELPGTRTFATGDRPVSVATGDFDADDKLDLVTANFNANTVSVLLGNNDGTFAPQQTFPTGSRPSSVAVGNLNWDTASDLVVANSLSDTVSVLLSNGDGTFQPKQDYAVSTSPAAVVLSDLDGDSRLDLAVADSGSGRVSVLHGKLDGTFEPQQTFLTDANPTAVLAANVMGDGASDLLTANTSSGSVSVLVNVSDPPPPPPPVPTTGAASSVSATSAALSATINPQGAHTLYKFEYGPTTSFGAVTAVFDAGSGTSPAVQPPRTITGLAPATTYYYRVCVRSFTSSGQSCGSVAALTTAGGPTAPGVTTSMFATNTGNGSQAAFQGTINAHGANTAYTFEWGKTTAFGAITPVKSAGSGTTGLAVTGDTVGLQYGQTYFYRLVATNSAGTTFGEMRTIVGGGPWDGVPPTATGSPESITATGAILTGTLNPSGVPTAFVFEYGVGTSLDRITAVDNAGQYQGELTVKLPTGVLTPGTTYCYRLVATNYVDVLGISYGTGVGALRCFTTASL
ncbi:MAG: hypothetical protein QOI73_2507 [Solirubrobacteraceae bacterium]|nr:hypothetical protein [Solirubrobacteraceae bacterium]